MNKIKRLLSVFLIFTFLISYIMPISSVLAAKTKLYCDHYTQDYLKFSNGNTVRTAVVLYDTANGTYPAYCLQPTINGVGEVHIKHQVKWE